MCYLEITRDPETFKRLINVNVLYLRFFKAFYAHFLRTKRKRSTCCAISLRSYKFPFLCLCLFILYLKVIFIYFVYFLIRKLRFITVWLYYSKCFKYSSANALLVIYMFYCKVVFRNKRLKWTLFFHLLKRCWRNIFKGLVRILILQYCKIAM